MYYQLPYEVCMSVLVRGNVYYVDVCIKGKRQKVSTGLIVRTGDTKEDKKNKEKAGQIALLKKAELQRRNVNGERIHDWLIGKRRQLQRWKVFLPEHFTWSDITLEFLLKLVKGLEKHGKYSVKREPDGSKTECFENYSPSTIHSYLDEITSMVKHAARRGECDPPDWVRKDIYNKPRQPKYKKVVNTDSELKKLIKTPIEFRNDILGEVWDTVPAWIFVLCTGLRFGDVRNFKWSDIIENEIYLKQQKTSRFNIIPLNEQAHSILEKMRKIKQNANVDDKVFNLPHHTSSLEHLEKWRQKAGISNKVTWHGARRNFATLLHQGGADIFTISRLLGHSDVRVTQRYVELRDTRKITATDNLNSILKGFQSN
jgi:integrase